MARIHTGRKSGFVLRGGSLRRETVWIDVVESFNALAVGTSILLNVTGAGVLALRPFTVVRTRGMIGIRTDQVAATEDQAASFGYAIVSDQAVAIGVTAVPTPVTDRSSDAWFVYEDILADINSVGSATSNMGNTLTNRSQSPGTDLSGGTRVDHHRRLSSQGKHHSGTLVERFLGSSETFVISFFAISAMLPPSAT